MGWRPYRVHTTMIEGREGQDAGRTFENNPGNSKWQMLRPLPEATNVFGINDVLDLSSWADFK